MYENYAGIFTMNKRMPLCRSFANYLKNYYNEINTIYTCLQYFEEEFC